MKTIGQESSDGSLPSDESRLSKRGPQLHCRPGGQNVSISVINIREELTRLRIVRTISRGVAANIP